MKRARSFTGKLVVGFTTACVLFVSAWIGLALWLGRDVQKQGAPQRADGSCSETNADAIAWESAFASLGFAFAPRASSRFPDEHQLEELKSKRIPHEEPLWNLLRIHNAEAFGIDPPEPLDHDAAQEILDSYRERLDVLVATVNSTSPCWASYEFTDFYAPRGDLGQQVGALLDLTVLDAAENGNLETARQYVLARMRIAEIDQDVSSSAAVSRYILDTYFAAKLIARFFPENEALSARAEHRLRDLRPRVVAHLDAELLRLSRSTVVDREARRERTIVQKAAVVAYRPVRMMCAQWEFKQIKILRESLAEDPCEQLELFRRGMKLQESQFDRLSWARYCSSFHLMRWQQLIHGVGWFETERELEALVSRYEDDIAVEGRPTTYADESRVCPEWSWYTVIDEKGLRSIDLQLDEEWPEDYMPQNYRREGVSEAPLDSR